MKTPKQRSSVSIVNFTQVNATWVRAESEEELPTKKNIVAKLKGVFISNMIHLRQILKGAIFIHSYPT